MKTTLLDPEPLSPKVPYKHLTKQYRVFGFKTPEETLRKKRPIADSLGCGDEISPPGPATRLRRLSTTCRSPCSLELRVVGLGGLTHTLNP